MNDDEFQYEESLKDDLEAFFSDPSKDHLPTVLQVDSEYDYLDFKQEWHEKSKLARHILAFSNSGGGIIVVGVAEDGNGNHHPNGIADPLDSADLGQKVEKYLPDIAHELYNLETYRYDEDVYHEEVAGKNFQTIFISAAGEQSPLVATNAGSNIDEGAIYVRRNTKSTEANYDEIQELLKKRSEGGIDKSTAELHEELQELKTLYSEIDKNKTKSKLAAGLLGGSLSALYTTERNENFPSQDYEEYISSLIKKKKIRIEERLGVRSISLS